MCLQRAEKLRVFKTFPGNAGGVGQSRIEDSDRGSLRGRRKTGREVEGERGRKKRVLRPFRFSPSPSLHAYACYAGYGRGYMVGRFVLLSWFESVATGYRADAVDFILKVRAPVV